MNNEYGPLLFYFGMMDENSSGHVLNATREMNAYIKDKKFYDAFLVLTILHSAVCSLHNMSLTQ